MLHDTVPCRVRALARHFHSNRSPLLRRTSAVALVLGPLLCAAIALAPTPAGLTAPGQAALAILAFCVVWWLGTPVALPVTSLVGLALLPVLGALPTQEALALFGNPAVFFVIGVFLVAAVLFQTGLSTRLTLLGLRRFSGSEDVLCHAVLGLSWAMCALMVSHAVAAIMLPIVLELIRALDLGPRSRTARRLLLGMAWGTVAGSNLTLLSSARATLGLELYDAYLLDAGLEAAPVGFLQFTWGAAPVSLCSVLIAGVVLRLAFPPEGVELAPAVAKLNARVAELGAVRRVEWLVLLGVLGMIACMVGFGPKWMGIVALLSTGVLFGLQALTWEDAEKYVNWGVVLMYGGAIAVGTALYRTGATTWLADTLLPEGMGPWSTFLGVAALSAGFTEIVSNSAVMAVVLPVALPLAEQVGLEPRAFAWVAPVSAGFAFVLPTSTPAMAMVFGTGYLRIRHTLPGIVVSVLSLVSLWLLARFFWPLIGMSALAGATGGATP